ncbi:acyltransferase family protein [Flexivirga oryzae]|uniref:Peptidoglycan/LPS O-acetylase OafA/YrhL n=1 Tax=Flexivirga oryzae TaxID=1794944 RepID=A0A839N0V6_9MICO|nr:acyltransferase family protein [Flexivirga oryzae]MBB2891360.1 peptidoglycan/LPS O-acetylase OafA/YrhL [Flexivirga oryzae]
MSPRPTGGGYRPALDGMRAVSVLTIMLFHVPYEWVTGGYWSVNVFFIVSGYLITGLLLKELDKWGSIDLVGFYMRRARRLLPALLIMLVVVSVVWPRILGDETPGTIKGDGLAALFYVANWRMVLTGQSYFEQFGTVAQSPFKHAWTLGIEEQYYLLFPILMIVLFRWFGRRNRGKTLGVIVALAGASAITMAKVYVPGGDPSRVYYGTDTRMQDILVGAALAIVMSMIDPRRLSAWARRNRRAVVGVGWIVAGLTFYWFFFIPASGWVFYGGYLVFDTMFALLVASVELVRSSSIAAVFSWHPLAWIGMLSYGLYLWHYPLFVLLTPDRTHLSGIPLQIVRFALTFAIASASYYFVEDPIRKGALRRLGKRIAAAVPIVAVIATATTILVSVNGMRLAPTARAGQGISLSGGSGSYRVLIVGDSVGFALGYYFPRSTFPDVNATAAVDFGCGTAEQSLVVQGKRQPVQSDCSDIFQHWAEGVSGTHPKVVVWTLGPWEVYDHYIDGKTLKVGSAAYARYLQSRLQEGLTAMNKAGRHGPLVIPTVPCLGQPKYMVNGVDMAPERNDPKRAAAVNGILVAFAAKHPRTIHLVDPGELVCPSGTFTKKVNGVQLRQDGVHYTKAGAAAFWKWLMPQIARWVPGTPKARS